MQLCVCAFLWSLFALSMASCPDGCLCDTERHLVRCQGLGLQEFPWNLSAGDSLRELVVRDNNITVVRGPEVSVYGGLVYLDLSHNGVREIEAGALQSLQALAALYLHHNRMSSLQATAFTGLGDSLTTLDLSHNTLTIMPPEVFGDLRLLEDLDLSGNGLSELGDNTFVGLGSLKHLKLDENHLASLPSFMHTPQLISLTLNNNQLTSLQEYSLSSLSHLHTLSVSQNGLETVSEMAFSRSPRLPLTYLYLSHNQLQTVPALSHLPSLTMLDLSHNPFTDLPAGTFDGLKYKRMRTLILHSLPQLSRIETSAFSSLWSLRTVQLYSCPQLAVVEKGAFSACSSLIELDLHGCGLETLKPDMVSSWASLQRLDLRHNPWLCDCQLRTLQAQLQSHNATVFGGECAEPLKLASVPLTKAALPPCNGTDDSTKQFEDRIMIGIFASTSCLLLVVGGVLMFKYRTTMCEQTQPGVDVYSYFVYHNPNRLARHHKIPPRRLQAKPRDPSRRQRHVTWSSTDTGLDKVCKASVTPRENPITEPSSSTRLNGDIQEV